MTDNKFTVDVDNIHIRDPYIFTDTKNAVYYLVSAGNTDDPKRGFMLRSSRNLKKWSEPVNIFTPPENWADAKDFWAPELHEYNSKYYLFATVLRKNDYRRTYIFESDTIDGTYTLITENGSTPKHWQCLDGTLFIEDGKPHMVFCHEWSQICNGAMCSIELSNDLKEIVGAPKLLFSATDAAWCTPLFPEDMKFPGYITDGPCMYRSSNGRLFMFWSSTSKSGYTVGLAESDNGRLDGRWYQFDTPFMAENGGHCALFRDLEGNLMMSLHQPNIPSEERMRIIRVKENSDGVPFADI